MTRPVLAAARVGLVVREVPNLLTVLRLLAVPVVVACLLADSGDQSQLRWVAWWAFGLAAATDALDGYLARRWHVISSFGKLADPLADKALVLGAMIALSSMGETPWWPLVIVGVRELGVTLGRLAVAKDVVIPASQGGKLKTTLQIVSLLLLLYPTHAAWVDSVGWWMLLASVAVAVVTGVDYAVRIGRIVRAHSGRDHSGGDQAGRAHSAGDAEGAAKDTSSAATSQADNV